ncbi:hypothetical protein HP1_115 [Candidatus Termititenax spirochaetophilus]|uniref:Uncharacterized protein n=1 Tax=Candidatus Termititenax spirochaetophilus TaxID=2218522 RepID=A0A388T8T1_9BACT|nr:hypothetical protein HP1_115 [Candidatus Termititenax spirochaetophilus]
MLKRILFFLLVLSALSQAAISVTVLPKQGGANVNFNAEVDSGFYGGEEGTIILTIDRSGADLLNKRNVYVRMDQWIGQENFRLQDGDLQWKVYYCNTYEGGEISGQPADWSAYTARESRAFTLDSAPKHVIEIGTMLRRVPSVQPNGVYNTNIEFYVDQ